MRRTVRRRTPPAASGPRTEGGGQRTAAGRADERHRREHAPSAGGRFAKFRGLRRRHLARPMVSGPHRDSHSGLRGRLAGRILRGRVRRVAENKRKRLGDDQPAPRRVPQADGRLSPAKRDRRSDVCRTVTSRRKSARRARTEDVSAETIARRRDGTPARRIASGNGKKHCGSFPLRSTGQKPPNRPNARRHR